MSKGFFTFKLPNNASQLDQLDDVSQGDRIIHETPYDPTANFFEQPTISSNPLEHPIIIKTPPKPVQDLTPPTVLGENCFIYYGAPYSMPKIFKVMRDHDKTDSDVYSWICEHNLQYRRVASIRTNWQIMIGREIKVLNDNPYRLDFDHPYEELDEQEIEKVRLKKEIENQLYWDLYDAGVHAHPKYYMSWNVLIPLMYRERPKPIIIDPRNNK